MKKYIFLYGFAFLSLVQINWCISQNNGIAELDSLFYYKSQVENYKFENPTLYIKFTEKIVNLIKDEKDEKFLFKAYTTLADIYKLEDNCKIAIKNYNLALEFDEFAENKNEIAEIYDKLVYIYRNMGELESMYECSEKAIKIKESIGDIKGIHQTKLILAYNHNITGNYIESFKISYDALDYFKKQKDTSQILLTYHNITLIYKALGNYKKALAIHDYCAPYLNEKRFIKESSTLINGRGNIQLDKGGYQSALNNFLKSLELENKIGNKMRILTRYNNIGVAYSYLNNFEPALEYFNECIKGYKDAYYYRSLANTYNSVGMLYERMNLPDSSIAYYQKSVDLSQKYNDKEVYILSTLALSRLYELEGDERNAFKYLKTYNQLIESINKSGVSQQIASQELDYLRQKDLTIKKIEHKNRVLFNISNTCILILVIIISWIIVKKLKKKIRKSQLDKRILEEHKAELNEQIADQNKELVGKILQLSDYNEGLQSAIQGLTKLKSEMGVNSKQKIQQVINNLEHSVNDNLWNEFEYKFIKVNPLLFENLSKNYPKLTTNERRLCALIHLNLSSKEIANITKQSHNSILVAKSRLKHRLNIQDPLSIEDFLHSIAKLK